MVRVKILDELKTRDEKESCFPKTKKEVGIQK